MTTWIFQCDPQVFHIDRCLRTEKTMLWTVRQEQYAKAICAGDEVFIWRLDGTERGSGGIVARGSVAAAPQLLPYDLPKLWVERPSLTIALRARVEIHESRLTESEGMLKRGLLDQEEALRDLRILDGKSERDHLISPKHARVIRRMWTENHTGPPSDAWRYD